MLVAEVTDINSAGYRKGLLVVYGAFLLFLLVTDLLVKVAFAKGKVKHIWLFEVVEMALIIFFFVYRR
jgi:hypothetical protein